MNRAVDEKITILDKGAVNKETYLELNGKLNQN